MAASCLLPVASHIVESLPERLSSILDVLWNCLADMKDDLGSSVGAVMELLGRTLFVFCDISGNSLHTNYAGQLVEYNKVIDILGDLRIS